MLKEGLVRSWGRRWRAMLINLLLNNPPPVYTRRSKVAKRARDRAG